MKYIVFSFDDGLLDFKLVALPILNKYNFKATLNIISGFVDKTVPYKGEYLGVEDISYLFANGFEIANHTDSHLKHGSFEEFFKCNQKINEWCGTSNVIYGIAMPKYSKPTNDSIRYLKQYNPPYITYEVQKELSTRNFLRRFRYKILSIVNKNKVAKLSYAIQRKTYKIHSSTCFRRIEVGKDIDCRVLFEALKSIKDGWCITLCFHSISNDYMSTTYPKGCLSINQFSLLLDLLYNDKNFMVKTQLEVCKTKKH